LFQPCQDSGVTKSSKPIAMVVFSTSTGVCATCGGSGVLGRTISVVGGWVGQRFGAAAELPLGATFNERF
jgi:hypothetical protein